MKTKIFLSALVGLLLVILIFQLEAKERLETQSQNNLAALADSVETVTNKLGETAYRVTTLESENTDLLNNVSSKDSTINRLKKLVEIYEDEIENGGSITVINSGTRVDTFTKVVYVGDTARFKFTDKWLDLQGEVLNDKLNFSLKTTDQFSLILGYERYGFLNTKSRPVAELIPSSPYTTISDIRSITIDKKPSKLNLLSVTGGATAIYINNQIFFGIGITLGPSYLLY